MLTRLHLGTRQYLAVGSLLAVLSVVLTAALTQGYHRTSVDLDDSGVWVQKSSAGLVGRFNTSVRLVDTAVAVKGTPVTLLQSGATVLVVDGTDATVSQVDSSYSTLGASHALPTGASVLLGGPTVAVVDPAGFTALPVTSLGTVDLVHAKPTATLAKGGVVAVGDDGETWAAEPGSATVRRYTSKGAADGSSTLKGDVLPADAVLQISAVGDVPVVLDSFHDVLHLPGRAPVDLSGLGQHPVLQQVGGDTGAVVVATDDHLLRIGLTTGATASLSTQGGGKAAPPVAIGPCAYAVWQTNGAYERDCTGADPVRATFSGDGSQLVLRQNRGRVVVNESDSGSVVPLSDGEAQRVDDWSQALRNDPVSSSDSQTNQTATVVQNKVDRSAANRPPVAKDDVAGTRAARPVIVPVLANDSDPDGDVLVVSPLAPLPADVGSLAVVQGGQAVQVTPAAGRVDPIVFPYTITDGRGGSASANVTVTIYPDAVNNPPVAVPDTVDVEAGRTVSVNVLANDTDPEGDLLALTAVDAPSGAATFTPAGLLTFTAPSVPGPVVITYTVTDDRGASSQGTLTATVEPAGNLPPHAVNDVATVVAGREVSVDVLANDTDANGDTLTVDRVDDTPGVTVTWTAQGEVTASAAVAGDYEITYEVTDGSLADTGLLRLVVLPAGGQHAPVAVTDEVSLRPNTPTPVAVLANDVDLDGNVLVIAQVTPPKVAGFTVEVLAHQTLRLTTSLPLTSTVFFTYVVSNGYGTATGTVVVRPLSSDGINSPPVANPDEVTVRAGATAAIPVLANDSDPDGDVLSLVAVTPIDPADGTLFLEGNELRYVAPSTERGGVTARYTVQDSAGNRTDGDLLIHVTPADPTDNHPPAPKQTTAAVFAGQQVTVDLPLQASDPDGDVVQLLGLKDPPSLGQVLSFTSSQLVYKADVGASGTDRLTYLVADQYGAQGIGVVLIGVVQAPGQDSPPVAINDQVVVKPGGSVTVDELRNDSDPDGDPITLQTGPGAIGTPRTGTVVVQGQNLVYTAPADAPANAQVSFDYSITDGRGGVATATVTVQVEADAVTVAPDARDDTGPTSPTGASLDIDVLANDDDPDGNVSDLTISLTGVPYAGVVAGKVHVTMPDHAVQFLYTVTNPSGLTARAVVSIPWQAPGVAPVVANPDEVSTGYQVPVTVDVLANDVGSPLSVTATAGVHGGTAAVAGSTVVFTPAPGFAGDGGFAYTMTDGRSTAVGTVLVHVAAQADRPPVLAPVQVSLAAGGQLTVDLAQSASDPDNGDVLTFSALTGAPAGVTATLSGSVLSLQAGTTAAGATGTLAVTVSDGRGKSVVGMIAVTVNSSDKPLPTAVADTATTDQGQQVTVHVLANDVDPVGKGLTVTAVGFSANGQTAVAGSDVTFTPDASFFGSSTFTYTITDATDDPTRMASGSVTITVVGRPGAPGVPVATGQQSSMATLSWAAPPNNGAPIDHYVVTTQPGATTTTCPSTSCVIGNLTNGTSYTFTVVAVNAAGTGDPSAASAAYTPNQVPGQVATPTTMAGDTTASVSWVPPTDSGSPVTGYLVAIHPSAGGGSQSVGASSTSTSFSGLADGTGYTFTVIASNAAGAGPVSNPSAVTVPAGVPATPASPSVTQGDTQVSLTWTAPSANGSSLTGYTVETLDSAGAVLKTDDFGSAATGGTITGLSNGSSYEFALRASNGVGPSAYSGATQPVTAAGAPAKPVVAATAGDTTASLTITNVNGNGNPVDHFEVLVNGMGPYELSTSDTTVRGLTDGTSYTFQVQTCTTTSCGPLSEPSNPAVTPEGPPAPPPPPPPPPAPADGPPTITSFTCSVSGTTITWTWVGNANGGTFSHYQLQVDKNEHEPDQTGTTFSKTFDTYDQGNALHLYIWNTDQSSTTWYEADCRTAMAPSIRTAPVPGAAAGQDGPSPAGDAGPADLPAMILTTRPDGRP